MHILLFMYLIMRQKCPWHSVNNSSVTRREGQNNEHPRLKLSTISSTVSVPAFPITGDFHFILSKRSPFSGNTALPNCWLCRKRAAGEAPLLPKFHIREGIDLKTDTWKKKIFSFVSTEQNVYVSVFTELNAEAVLCNELAVLPRTQCL